MSTSRVTPPSSSGAFPRTHWSIVVAAGQATDTKSREALSRLCETYWTPLYGYVRRRGHGVDDAHDLTQEFFLRLLERNLVARADKSKGRFRSFIFTVLKRFLADEWDKEKSQKRGGDVHLESLSQLAEAAYSSSNAATDSPELEFERDWAMALLTNVLNALEQEYASGGKTPLFAALRNYLVGGSDTKPYAHVAAELGMSEAAFKVAVCRIRQRYRERMKQEVAATVADARDADAELRHLFRILSKSR